MPANFGKIDPEQTPEEREAQAQEEASLFAPGGKLSDAFKAPPPKVPNPPAAKLPEPDTSEQFGAGYARAFGGGQAAPPTAQRAQLAHQLGKALTPKEPDTETPALQKAVSPSATPPSRPPLQLVPTPPSGSPKPVINLPKGAGTIPATATMFLFVSLALVTMWPYVVKPLIIRGAVGNKIPILVPTSGIISLLLFGVVLVFVSELSPEAASFTALLMFGLWAVFLIMHPEVVQAVASWMSQGNAQWGKQAATATQSHTSSNASKKGA